MGCSNVTARVFSLSFCSRVKKIKETIDATKVFVYDKGAPPELVVHSLERNGRLADDRSHGGARAQRRLQLLLLARGRRGSSLLGLLKENERHES